MTIYSTHSNRGKIQILATYRTPTNATSSSTVTSVDDPKIADSIVDALNRISACATVPLSTYDRRDERLKHYPTEHLNSLIDPDARPDLITGTHSLWYELAMSELHTALTDLEQTLLDTPAPVRLAIGTELRTEAVDLQAALREYSEGIEPTEPVQRMWDHGLPFLMFEGGMDELSDSTRELLNGLEEDASPSQVKRTIAGMRILLAAQRRTTNQEASLDVTALSILDDPDWGNSYYLSIDYPMPISQPRQKWSVNLGLWTAEDLDDDGTGTSTGSPVVTCDLDTTPSIDELVGLLDLSAAGLGQLKQWVTTPVGEPLAGTRYVVTQRDDID